MCYMSNSLSDNHLLHWNLITQICGMILTLFPFESVPGHHRAILPWLALNSPRAGRKPSQACFLRVRERKPCDRREGVGLKIVAYIKACSESHSVSNSHLRTFWQDSVSFSLESRAQGSRNTVPLWRKSRCFPGFDSSSKLCITLDNQSKKKSFSK